MKYDGIFAAFYIFFCEAIMKIGYGETLLRCFGRFVQIQEW